MSATLRNMRANTIAARVARCESIANRYSGARMRRALHELAALRAELLRRGMAGPMADGLAFWAAREAEPRAHTGRC